MEDEIVNRVASSPLKTFDLEDYYHSGERQILDIAPWLFNGMILKEKDFRDFDYILAMDSNNLSNIKILDQADQFGDKLFLMRDFDPENSGGDVPDPYFGGETGFQNVYDILNRSVENFIDTELI